EAFAARTRGEWLRILEEAGVPRAPVLTREEFARDLRVAHNEMLIDVADPEVGATHQMGIPVRLAETPGCVRGAAPRLGEHQSLLEEAKSHSPALEDAA